jgi:hypothetical protein
MRVTFLFAEGPAGMTGGEENANRFVCLHCRRVNDDGAPCPCLVVDLALAEGAQAVIQPDVPLAMADELAAAVQGRAVRDVLAARVRQIVDHGHLAETDDFLPIGWLPLEARQRFDRARDLMHDEHRDLQLVRATIVDGLALGLAAIDRLDRATSGGQR